jgi:hypothetical protein
VGIVTVLDGRPKGERFRPGYYEGIRDRAAKLPNVEFTGFLPLAQVEPWFDRARVLVSPSVYEGMPNVFLQAWARGVPIVSTVDVGVSVNRLFKEVDEAARQIEQLFEDEGQWSEASSRAREHFRATHAPEQVEPYRQLSSRRSQHDRRHHITGSQAPAFLLAEGVRPGDAVPAASGAVRCLERGTFANTLLWLMVSTLLYLNAQRGGRPVPTTCPAMPAPLYPSGVALPRARCPVRDPRQPLNPLPAGAELSPSTARWYRPSSPVWFATLLPVPADHRRRIGWQAGATIGVSLRCAWCPPRAPGSRGHLSVMLWLPAAAMLKARALFSLPSPG